MDILGIIMLSGWLVTILLIASVLILYSVYCLTVFWRLGVPGPRPTLYLGNVMSFIKKGVYGTDLENVEKYGKIYGMYAGNMPSLIVSDVDLMKQICIKDFSKFPNRVPPCFDNDPITKGALSLSRGEHWKFMRTTISPTFSSGKLRQMVPLLQKATDNLVEKLKEYTANGEPVDVCTHCGAFSMEVIASTAFGMEVDTQNNPDHAFIKNSKKAFRGFQNPFLIIMMFFPCLTWVLPYLNVSGFPKDVSNFFSTAVNSVIEDRKTQETSRKDLLWLLLNAHKDIEQDQTDEKEDLKTGVQKRPLTNQEILANALLFMVAGYETTANVLSFCMYCLALYPEYAEKVQEEVDESIRKEKPTYDNVGKLQYLDMFICEVLRLYASATRFNRIAEEDVKIGEYLIPKGVDVQFPVCAIHRDPKLWPDPEVFDPERFTAENKTKRHPYAWIPFGVGPRNCVGMRLALTELKMAVVAVVQNFKVLRCEETEVPVTFDKGGTLKAANGIKLKFEER